MKQFVKALKKDGDCFKYICTKFSGSMIEKLKAVIIHGPQIRIILNDRDFPNSMNERFRAADINGRLDLSLTWRVSEDPLKRSYKI